MRYPIIAALILFLLGHSSSTNPDDSLPFYLRGMNWNKVQEYAKEDLRLSNAVHPTNYDIELFVNVRGHAGADKSDFNGTVFVYLNITTPVDTIELHSNGLTIEKALIDTLTMGKSVGISKITSNLDRETITIHTNRTIQPEEKFMLQIIYRGVAKLDEYGLYESWDPKFNKSLDSNGPFILATKSFPTGAPFWFPCFDEGNKRATFQLRINHPSELNAYSNTKIERTEIASNGRFLSIFEKTHLLSTYQVALSINHLSSEYLEVPGYDKVRLIRSLNSNDFDRSYPEYTHRYGWRFIHGIPSLIMNKLSDMHFGEMPKGKLDIIILEGTRSNSIQPGLVTIGRSNLWNKNPAVDITDLAQVRIGTSIYVNASNLMWLNNMFSRFLVNEATQIYLDVYPEMLESSLHEKPLRDLLMQSTTTKQYLTSKQALPSMKASQMLRLLIRYCPESNDTLNNFFANHNERLTELDHFIYEMTDRCQDQNGAKEFLESYINQPGKAFLTVKRLNNSVIIEQTRYHSSYFDSTLRDNKTRYTIPLFFTIDGEYSVKMLRKNESLEISVPDTSTFLVDHEYDHLYFAYYEDVIVLPRNVTEEEHRRIVLGLQKGMVSAIYIGFVKYRQIVHRMMEYVNSSTFIDSDFFRVYDVAFRSIKFEPVDLEYSENQWDFYDCEHWYGLQTDWDGSFNNDTKYWREPLNVEDLAGHMNCLNEWANATDYRSFLEKNFFGENTAIRPIATYKLANRNSRRDQWKDLHRFFFRNAANFSNHRFDMLAETVLIQDYVSWGYIFYQYPNPNMWDDYLNELRDFVIRNPRRAASLSTEIEIRLEREFIQRAQSKWHNETREAMHNDHDLSITIRRKRKENLQKKSSLNR